MKQIRKIKRRGISAFTLTELIVVLVILAVLAAMLTPALTGYIKRARRAKYIDAADEARVACQAVVQELYGLSSDDTTNNVAGQTSDGNNVCWNKGEYQSWGDKVLTLMNRGRGAANNEPYILVFGVGTHKAAGGMSLTQKYTVYYIAYVEDENSPALFYVNGEWMYKYPRGDTDKFPITKRTIGGTDFRNTIIKDDAEIPLQFFIVSNRTGLSDTDFWRKQTNKKPDPRTLEGHSEGNNGY